MVLTVAADGPFDCTDWDDLCDENGFLARGRNRYPVTYVIYTDGTYYYAEDGTTGNLDFGGPNNRGGISGTSFPLVFQTAIDATNATGGIIRLRAGNYDLVTTTVTLNYHGTHVEGEGSDLTGTRGTIITYSGADVAIDISAAVRLQRITIKNLGIVAEGNAKTSAAAIGIRVVNAEDIKIWNVMIREFEAGTAVGVSCDNTSYVGMVVINNCYFWDNKFGVFCQGDSLAHEVNAVIIYNSIIIGPVGPIVGSRAVTFDEWTNACLMFGGDMETYETAMYVDGDDNGFFRTRTEDISGTHLQVNATAGNTRMFAHRFYGAGIYVADAGTDTRLVNCTPYVTQNMGTVVMLNLGNAIVVPHGLGQPAVGIAPDAITVTGTTADTTDLYVDTVGVLNFTIRKAAGATGGNRDIYWKAEVFA